MTILPWTVGRCDHMPLAGGPQAATVGLVTTAIPSGTSRRGISAAWKLDIRFGFASWIGTNAVGECINLVSMLEQWQCSQHRMRTVLRRIYAAHLTACRVILEQLEQVEIDAFPTAFVTD
jgi:hypothetical protein